MGYIFFLRAVLSRLGCPRILDQRQLYRDQMRISYGFFWGQNCVAECIIKIADRNSGALKFDSSRNTWKRQVWSSEPEKCMGSIRRNATSRGPPSGYPLSRSSRNRKRVAKQQSICLCFSIIPTVLFKPSVGIKGKRAQPCPIFPLSCGPIESI